MFSDKHRVRKCLKLLGNKRVRYLCWCRTLCLSAMYSDLNRLTRDKVCVTVPSMNWHDDPELGLISDVEIAARYGLSRQAVHVYRQRKGIALTALPPPPRASWHDDPQIGRLPDAAIAERYGIHRQCVYDWRKRQGIEHSQQRSRPAEERRKAVEAALRANPQQSSREVARQFNVAPQTVQEVKEALGIQPEKTVADDVRELAAQGMAVGAIADKLGISYQHAYMVLRR